MTNPDSMRRTSSVEEAKARTIVLPCLLLVGAMFNLTLVVAGLKEFIIEDLGGTVAHATLFFSVETLAYLFDARLQRLVHHIDEDDIETAKGRHLGDSMAHGTCTDHANRVDFLHYFSPLFRVQVEALEAPSLAGGSQAASAPGLTFRVPPSL